MGLASLLAGLENIRIKGKGLLLSILSKMGCFVFVFGGGR